MKKSDLEKTLGKKLTKEEYKIEIEKIYESWTKALEEDDDEELSIEEQLTLHMDDKEKNFPY